MDIDGKRPQRHAVSPDRARRRGKHRGGTVRVSKKGRAILQGMLEELAK